MLLKNIKEIYQKNNGIIPVILLVVIIFIILADQYSPLINTMPDWLTFITARSVSFFTVFLGIFFEAAPFLAVGTIISGFIEVFLREDDLVNLLPKQRFSGVLLGSLLGLLFPVCECGVIPVVRRMLIKKVSPATSISFLLAAPIINPIVIASTWTAFGNSFVFWGRLIMAFSIAMIVGLIFSFQDPSDMLLGECNEICCSSDHSIEPHSSAVGNSMRSRFQKGLIIAGNEFFELGKYLVIGSLLAAFLQTFVPRTFLLDMGSDKVLSIIVLIGLAVLLSICSTVDSFIALSFANTFTIGAVLAFLVFGTMIDIKSITMYRRVFRPGQIAYLILLPLLLTLIITVGLNYYYLW